MPSSMALVLLALILIMDLLIVNDFFLFFLMFLFSNIDVGDNNAANISIIYDNANIAGANNANIADISIIAGNNGTNNANIFDIGCGNGNNNANIFDIGCDIGIKPNINVIIADNGINIGDNVFSNSIFQSNSSCKYNG